LKSSHGSGSGVNSLEFYVKKKRAQNYESLGALKLGGHEELLILVQEDGGVSTRAVCRKFIERCNQGEINGEELRT